MKRKRLRLNELKFHEQPLGSGACGKYAIQNALEFLNIHITQDVIDLITQTSKEWTAKYGTDENQIRQAMRALNLESETYTIKDIKEAKKKIEQVLKRTPIILATQSGEHWIAVGGKSGNYYIIADSARRPIIRRHTWKQLCEHIGYDNKYFYFIRIKK
jgi:ABC-type bacteriocin/lantibiotic exporter with double-glycine peptidase domain